MSAAKGLVLVTGAGKRIGRAIALEMATAGWDVAVHCHASLAEAEETAGLIRKMGRKALVLQADLADSEAVKNLIPEINAKAGPLAALVNNASLFERDDNDPEGMRHRAVNLQAPLALSNSLRQHLPPDASGAIVNLLDAGPIPAFFGAYLASKAKLREATLDMALNMAPRVRVNAVAPGPTLRNARETPAHFEALVAATPLGLQIPPETVAASVRFLAENPFITGEIVHVDGGSHLKS